MAASAGGNKDGAMAAHLVKSGYPHGRRKSSAMPDSGGTTGVNQPGSSKNHRRAKNKDRA